jgi:hypothetical protein
VLGYGSRRLDVGCLCYLDRKTDKAKGGAKMTRQVINQRSLSASRLPQIMKLISYLSEDVASGSKRLISCLGSHRGIRQFIDWCDENSHTDVLESVVNADRAFRAYVSHLRHLVQTNQMKLNSATRKQTQALEHLRRFHVSDQIGRGVNLLVMSNAAYESTAVPDDDAQTKTVAWCSALFDGLTDLVLENQKYPYSLNVPEYLGWPDNQILIYPVPEWFSMPGRPGANSAISYPEGRLFTPDEIIENRKQKGEILTLHAAKAAILGTKRNLDKCNTDPRSADRRVRAQTAINAFFLLFIAETGMNAGQAISLAWSAEIEAETARPNAERQGFRAIKYRAGGALVSFEIGTAFLPSFRKFLKLRNFLLDGASCDTLFFTKRGSSQPSPITLSVQNSIFTAIKRADPDFAPVTVRQWRSAKQDWAISTTDPATAARLMQHSEITALRRYSNGTIDKQQAEMTAFFDQIETVVVDKHISIPNSKDTALGTCTSMNNPVAINPLIGLKPECGKPEGCLFCDKFRVHADAVDVRKLLSCRYLVNQTLSYANNLEQFNSVFGPVLQRIEFMLDEIGKRDATLVSKLCHEVEELGELTPYWSSKIELLQELGLI